jgi:tetratricopeptide (TPR) repeat protein
MGVHRSQVFISYSHRDKAWLTRLQTHLKPLERKGLLERWDDTRIKAGERWQDEIHKAINSTKVAILLISPDFLASDFIAENELPSLLKAAEKEGAVILPIFLRPSVYLKMDHLSQFQAVNPPDKALADLSEVEQDRFLVQVAERVSDLCDYDSIHISSTVTENVNHATPGVLDTRSPRIGEFVVHVRTFLWPSTNRWIRVLVAVLILCGIAIPLWAVLTDRNTTSVAHEIEALREQGYTLQEQGKYAQATEEFGSALKLAKKIDDQVEIAKNLGNLGKTLFLDEKYDRAESYLTQALEESRKLPSNHPEHDVFIATDHYNLGSLYYELGQFAEAKENDAKAKKNYQAVLTVTKDPTMQAATWFALGCLFRRRGLFSDSEDAFRTGLSVSKGVKMEQFRVKGHFHLAALYDEWHKFAASKDEQRHAESMAEHVSNEQKKKIINRHYEFCTKRTSTSAMDK